MKFPPFEYVAAADLHEAVEALAADEDAKVLAGGQSLLPLMALRLARPSVVVDLGRIDAAPPTLGGGVLVLDALTRQVDVEHDAQVGASAPLVAEAIGHVGHRATRALGTVGGSLAHADPAAELPAVMVALGASVRTVSSAGGRSIACADLFTGHFTTVLAHDEIITAVEVPAVPEGTGAAWCEWAPRFGDFADAGIGVCVQPGPTGTCTVARAAASGVAPTPVELTPLLAPLLEGVTDPGPGVLRAVAAVVEAECASELAGLLAARAVHRAFAATRPVSGAGAAA